MGSSNVVVHVANREINRVVYVLTGCDRDGGFVGADYDGDEHRSMCRRVHSDEVLSTTVSKHYARPISNTYTLVPGPVSTHKVVVLLVFVLEVAVRSVVNTRGELRVSEDIVDDLPGVTVP